MVRMAEAEQGFVENNEEQNFSIQDIEQHHVAGDEFDQQNLVGNVPEEYHFVGDESENQGLAVNDQILL